MPFIVQASDQIVIGSLSGLTPDDFLRVTLEDKSQIFVRSSGGNYPNLTFDAAFLPTGVATLARKAARLWLLHRSRYPSQEQLLKEAFEARPNQAQRLREFVACALLETVSVKGSSHIEVPASWADRDYNFNIGRYPWVMFGQDLRLPNSEEPLQGGSNYNYPELIIPSKIVGIKPIDRWDVEIQWALR